MHILKYQTYNPIRTHLSLFIYLMKFYIFIFISSQKIKIENDFLYDTGKQYGKHKKKLGGAF